MPSSPADMLTHLTHPRRLRVSELCPTCSFPRRTLRATQQWHDLKDSPTGGAPPIAMLCQRVFLGVFLLVAATATSSQHSLGGRRLTGGSYHGRTLQQRANGSVDYVQQLLARYYSNRELEAHLQDFVRRCGSISKLSSIGRSVRGVPLWVLEMSDKPGVHEPEPNVKYVANIHGDEASGRQLLPALAEWLCANYMTEPLAKRVVNGMHLFLMPSMNPDGYAMHSRLNANNRDLNRNFPDPVYDPSMTPTGKEEPEVKAVMNWTLSTPGGFVASGGLHEGELVVNYPWDATANGSIATSNASSDDATFRFLSLVYAKHNPGMINSKDFENGITNGAAWYGIYGGMQDWNYVVADDFDVTLELSKQKTPPDLQRMWRDNHQSLLDYILTAALGGVRGYVFEAPSIQVAGVFVAGHGSQQNGGMNSTAKPLLANITVEGIDKVLKSKHSFGNFYRPLAPGEYTLIFSSAGFSPEIANITVPEDNSGIELEVYLSAN